MRLRLVKTSGFTNADSECYGQVDKEYVRDLVRMNAIVEGERKNMNYFQLKNGKLVHIYNIFELNE